MNRRDGSQAQRSRRTGRTFRTTTPGTIPVHRPVPVRSEARHPLPGCGSSPGEETGLGQDDPVVAHRSDGHQLIGAEPGPIGLRQVAESVEEGVAGQLDPARDGTSTAEPASSTRCCTVESSTTGRPRTTASVSLTGWVSRPFSPSSVVSTAISAAPATGQREPGGLGTTHRLDHPQARPGAQITEADQEQPCTGRPRSSPLGHGPLVISTTTARPRSRRRSGRARPGGPRRTVRGGPHPSLDKGGWGAHRTGSS